MLCACNATCVLPIQCMDPNTWSILLNRMNPTTSGICPSCRHPASLALLRPCRDVETTLQHFKDVRPPLLLLVQSQHSDSHPTTDTNTSTTASSIPINTMKKLSHMDFHKQSKEKIKKAIEKLTVNSRKKLRLDGDKGIPRTPHVYVCMHASPR